MNKHDFNGTPKRRLGVERLEDRRLLAGPYAPAAGQPGSTAIASENPAIVAWATEIVEYAPGTELDAAFQTPLRALGPAEGNAADVVSLGRGGSITLGFADPIRDGLGFDFAVFENAFSDTFLELGFVEVSSNGVDFFRFPSDSLTAGPVTAFGSVDPTEVHQLAGKYRAGYGTPFDLGQLEGLDDSRLDLTRITQVRIVDVVGDGSDADADGDPIYDPYPTVGSAGFDLDAVGVLHVAESVRDVIGFEDVGDTLPANSAFIGPVVGGTVVTGPYNDQVVMGEFASGSLSFNNAHSLTYSSWAQFGYSNQSDTVTPGYLNQTSSFAGGGAGGSTTFGVGFWDQGGFYDPPTIRRQSGDSRAFESIKVTNTTYAALSMRDGDDFAKKFGGASGNDPDYLLLSIIGKDTSGNVIDVIEFALADYRFDDNTQDYIVDDWVEVDLNRIAEAHSIEFAMASTDVGPFGINTPTYFAIDDITLREPVLPFDLRETVVSENAGAAATLARISRPDNIVTDAVVVTLSVDNAALVTVPETVTIPSGERFAEFPIGVIDNELFEATRSVSIKASASQWVASTKTLRIENDDIRKIQLGLPSVVSEGQPATATIMRNDADPSEPLVVTMTSADPALMTVPATVTIAAGEVSADFQISGVDDNLYQTGISVLLSATSDAYEGDNGLVAVVDNDSPTLSIESATNAISESDGALNVDFEDVGRRIPAESFYNGSDEAGGFVSGGLAFSNEFNPQFGSWSGWSYSNSTDKTTPGFLNQYSASVGAGSLSSDTYAVASTFSAPRVRRDPTVHGGFRTVDIVNTTYAKLSMEQGDSFAKKFGGSTGDDPDFFLLTIEGIDAAGASVGTVDFYLADYRFADNREDYIVDQWTTVDVSTLSSAIELVFSLSSSDVGAYGMNTPAYFAADRFTFANDRPEHQIKVSRNTIDTSEPLEVTLTSSDDFNLRVPDVVLIPAGSSSVTVPISVVDDSLSEGDSAVQLTASAVGFLSGAQSLIVLDDDQPELTLTMLQRELFEGDQGRMVIHRNVADVSGSLSLALAVEPVGQLVLPTVEIPPGMRSIELTFSVVDNNVVDVDRTVTVGVRANGFSDATAELLIRNDDVPPPELTLLIDRNVLRESDGIAAAATVAVIRGDDDLSLPLEVFLTATPIGELAIPESLTIPAGVDQVEILVSAIDDLLVDGDQEVIIRASAEDHLGSQVTVVVEDDDVPTIRLSVVDAAISESAGSTATQLVVRRNTVDVSQAVVVAISASGGDVVMRNVARIRPGEDYVFVDIGALDNLVRDGDRSVQIEASAAGFDSVPVELTILDNEISAIRVHQDSEEISVDELLGEAEFGVSLASQPLSNVFVDVAFDAKAIVVRPNRVLFTPGSWNQPQSVQIVGVPDLSIDPDTSVIRLSVDPVASNPIYADADAQSVLVHIQEQQPTELRILEDDEHVFLTDVVSGVRVLQATHSDGLQIEASDLAQDVVLHPLLQTTGPIVIDTAGGDDRVRLRASNFTILEGGAGRDQLIVSLNHEVELADLVGGRTIGFEEYVIDSEVGATVWLDLDRVDEMIPQGTESVALRILEGQEVRFRGSGVAETPVMYGAEFVQVIAAGDQRFLVISPKPWQNALSRWDVNYDGSVSSLDALVAVNQLARIGQPQLPTLNSLSVFTGAYYDVSGDGQLTARDPLIVINEISRRQLGSEGEFVPPSRSATWHRSDSVLEPTDLPSASARKISLWTDSIDLVMESMFQFGKPFEADEGYQLQDSWAKPFDLDGTLTEMMLEFPDDRAE